MGGWTNWRGTQLASEVHEASREAVETASEILLEKGKNEVPLNEGTLMKSGTVKSRPNTHPDIESCISFGGGRGTGKGVVPYALKWHENSAHFQRGRKKRYLADPINVYGKAVLNGEIDKALGKVLK